MNHLFYSHTEDSIIARMQPVVCNALDGDSFAPTVFRTPVAPVVLETSTRLVESE